MQKNSTQPTYDPRLPNQEYLDRDSGKHNVPTQPARNPGTTSPTPEEIKNQERHEQRKLNNKDAQRAEAALTTPGEEDRPKDGKLDGGTAR